MKLVIPVKPEVKDFFCKNPDILGKEPCVIRKNSRIGIWICTVLAHLPPRNPDDYTFIPQDSSMDELEPFPENTIHCELTFNIPHNFLTDDRLLLLGRILETMMEFYALAWMRGRMDYMPSENSAATEFHKKHKINDGHIKADAYRQLYRRSKQANDTKSK